MGQIRFFVAKQDVSRFRAFLDIHFEKIDIIFQILDIIVVILGDIICPTFKSQGWKTDVERFN